VTDLRRLILAKPTLQTKFHIDFDWWSQSDQDWRVYLQSLLCLEHQQAFANFHEDISIDWVDPETAEVQRVDGLQNILITHCAKQPSFITEHTAIVDALFRIFLSNGNEPMSPQQLGERLNRPPLIILNLLSGRQVYRGIRPVLPD
jgi:hypothetical protein